MNKFAQQTVVACCSFLVLTAAFGSQTITFGAESDADRNKRIEKSCESLSLQYMDGDSKTTPMCQQAINTQCLADSLCAFYKNSCIDLKARVAASCETLAGIGDRNCPPCKVAKK